MNLTDDDTGTIFAGMSPSKQIPELSFLLTQVESKYGHNNLTSSDFEKLADKIYQEIGIQLSSSTLKRLWGYVSLQPVPRRSTLDALSKYIGKRDFKSFCDDLKDSPQFESYFFTTECISVTDLEKGDRITIGWMPDRVVMLEYLGDFNFQVISSENSKLQVGDQFQLSNILMGYPLYISRILRDGEYTSAYVAGRIGGLNLIKKD